MRLEEFSEAEFQKALQRTIRALTRGKTIPDQLAWWTKRSR